MTLATRLVIAGAGASFIIPSPVEVALTSAPNGGWPGGLNQGGIAHNGVVYFGWVDSAGNVEIATYTESTGTVSSPTTLHATLEADWHDAPAIAILPDGRIIAVYCRHSGTQMFVRVSTEPEDISAFDAEVDIDSQLGGTGYTYPLLFVNGSTVHLFYRTDGAGGNGEPSTWRESTSTDGVTWAAQTAITTIPVVLSYLNVDMDADGRFDFAITDGTTDAENADVFHFYREGGAYFQSDGTAMGSPPFEQSDMTLVHDGSTGGARYIAAVRAGSNPIITWPEHTGGAEDWYYARWDGAAWDVTNVVSDGATGEAWLEGGFSPEYADPSVAWLSRSIAGTYEVSRYRSFDVGATWISEQISDSPSDDFSPLAVRNADRLRAIWLRGTASSEDVFSLGIMGGRR